MIDKTDDPALKNELEKKNERREKVLESMRREIKEEAAYHENQQ